MQESNRIEFKQELNDKLEKEIVAFLNNQEGGVLYIGLDDSGHPVSNLDVDKTQLKIARYAGKDKVNLIENEEYGYCSLIKATHRVLDKFKVENTTMAKITDTTRIEQNLVEGLPLREAIINAVVHNDYSREYPPVFEIFSDRMEITSYGGLIQGQSLEDFFSGGSMPRNRELMRVFKDVELVEQLGSGMGRILQVYTRSVFHISEHFIKVVLPLKSGTQDGTQDERLIKLVKQNPKITRAELAIQLNTSPRTVQRILNRLTNVKFVGSGYSGHWSVEE